MKNKIVDKKGYTLRKTSDTGPSFSDAASSCLTFSSPLIIACISSAKDFNCIWKKKGKKYKHHPMMILKITIKKEMFTLVAASRLTNSR
jgi:hypothetical protein